MRVSGGHNLLDQYIYTIYEQKKINESIKNIASFFSKYLQAICRLKKSRAWSSYVCFKESRGSEFIPSMRAAFASCNIV